MTQPTQPFQPPPRPQPQFVPIAPQGKPPKRKRFGWIALLSTGLVALFLGIGIGTAGDGGGSTASPAPTATRTITEVPGENTAPTAQPTATVTVTAQPPKATAKPKDTGPAGELGEGTYEVGKDVKAGRYKTTVPGDSAGCYWERAKDDSGDFDSIIANDNADPGARVSVTIKNGEFFKNNGCGDWARQ